MLWKMYFKKTYHSMTSSSKRNYPNKILLQFFECEAFSNLTFRSEPQWHLLVSHFSKIIFSSYISSNDDALLISDVYQMTSFQTFQNSIFALLTFLRFFTIPSPSATSHSLSLSLSLTHFITTLCLHLLVMFVIVRIVRIVFFRFILSLWEGWNKIIALSFMNMVKLFLVSLFFYLLHTLSIYFYFSLSFRMHLFLYLYFCHTFTLYLS